MSITGNELLTAVQKQVNQVLTLPGMDLQLMLSAVAVPDIKVGMTGSKSEVMLRIARAFRENNIVFAKA